jgi:DNA-binding LytR/AlgR family response regulator
VVKPSSSQVSGKFNRCSQRKKHPKTRLDECNLREFGRSVLHMLAARSGPGRYIDRLVVKGSGTTRFIRVADIDWIEGAGVYVNLHVAGQGVPVPLSVERTGRLS